MSRIRTTNDIERFLMQLVKSDPSLEAVKEIAGRLPLRLSNPNFAGLADIVVSQHVSKLSAAAIMRRLLQSVTPFTATKLLETGDEDLIEVGLTRAKRQTLQRLATAICDGELDLKAIADLPQEEAIANLTAFKGVGPWTAEVFLLFCGGHTDVFPAGDVALRTAIGEFFEIQPRPSVKEVKRIADRWAPLRGVAARLFWGYYAALKDPSRSPVSRREPSHDRR